jgi:hypothetical protein
VRRPSAALFVWLISHQTAVLFSQNEPATNKQPIILFSQNKPASDTSHPPNEQLAGNHTSWAGVITTRIWPKHQVPRRYAGAVHVDPEFLQRRLADSCASTIYGSSPSECYILRSGVNLRPASKSLCTSCTTLDLVQLNFQQDTTANQPSCYIYSSLYPTKPPLYT